MIRLLSLFHKRKPVVVEHVRYLNRPKPDPRETAIEIARRIGRGDLAERLEALRQ